MVAEVPPALACPGCGGVWWECGGFVAGAENPDDQQIGLGAFQIDAEGNPITRSGVWLCIKCGAPLPGAGVETVVPLEGLRRRALAQARQQHPAAAGPALRLVQGGVGRER